MSKWLRFEKDSDGFDRTRYLWFGQNTFAHLENDWPQMFGGFNWETYRVADINYENDVMLGGHEFTFVLFGFGFRIRYNNPDNELMLEMEATAERLSSEHSGSRQASPTEVKEGETGV